MKQNSTNVFNEGLNYDLNPITTPNNILTDCVNGTFLTFNGDELALQNDAGNTKIQVPGTNPAKYVELTEGFYPLGIKEYGGVLYIVSAKLPIDTSASYVSGTKYKAGDIVTGGNYETTYYLCKLDNNTTTLPAKTNAWWEVIGDLKDYNNRFAEVEFGSYPSPEASGEIEYDGIPREFTAVNDFDSLYNKILINDAFFKTTRYITFDGSTVGTNGTDYISNYTTGGNNLPTYNPMFYSVKLYHQLSSGYLDLTENIWSKYVEYLQTNNVAVEDRFWFTEDFFRYYCPSQYKGKLFLSVEIEELEKFELASYPRFDPNGENYDFVINILGIGTGVIDITHARVEIWIDEVKVDFDGDDYIDIVIDPQTQIAIYTHEDIDASYYNKVLRYRITPVLEVDNITYTEKDLPNQYIEQYVIEGSRLINTLYDNIDFILTPDDECYPNSSIRKYVEAILTDSAGNLIDNDLTTSVFRYVFLHTSIDVPTWESVNPDDFVMGTYNIINAKPVMVNLTAYAPPDIVVSIFEGIPIEMEDIAGCISDDLITPFFLGVDSNGIPTILSETGEYKTQFFATNLLSTVPDAKYISIAYDQNDKLLFVGGKNGTLHIFDVNNQDAIVHKPIKVHSYSNDLAGVTIIKKGINGTKEIMIGHSDNKAFKQTYFSNIDSYKNYDDSVETGGFQDSNVGYVTSFWYYGGQYYCSTSDFEIFVTGNTTNQWRNITDIAGYSYRLLGTETKLWNIGYKSGSGATERILWAHNYSSESFNNEIHLNGQSATVVRDAIPLNDNELLITATNSGDGLWRVREDMTSQSLVSDMETVYGSCYYNNTNFLFTGGICYDNNKYAYAAFSKNNGYLGYEYTIAKINAYPIGLEAKYQSCVPTPSFYYKLYLY